MRAVTIIITNESRGYTIDSETVPLDGSTPWGDENATMGHIFRHAQWEGCGRCQSRVFRNLCTPAAEHIGYFFISRQPCDTDDGTYYTRGVWVVVGEANTITRRRSSCTAEAVA